MDNKTWAKSTCRLCLQKTFDNISTITNEISTEIFEVLLFRPNLHISNSPVMCTKCKKSLQNAIGFKKSRKMLPKKESTTISNSDKFSECKTLCHFCMTFPVHPKYLLSAKQNMLLTGILNDPGIKLKTTSIEDPLACEKCYRFIQDILQFTTTCLNVEDKINRYVEIEGTNGNSQVDLNDVREFPKKSSRKRIPSRISDVAAVNNGRKKIKSEVESENSVTLTVDDLMRDSDSEQSETEVTESVEADVSVKTEAVDIKKEEDFDSLVDTKGRQDSQVFICKLCSYLTRFRHIMVSHLFCHKSKLETNVFRCQKCSFTTKYRWSFTAHMIAHQDVGEIAMFQCSKCNFQTKYKYNLIGHELLHKNREDITMFDCPTCNRRFKRKYGLKKHIQHCKPRFIKCNTCEYATISKEDFNAHLLTHQDASKVTTFRCHLCSYKTMLNANLNLHLKGHKKYECTSCDYKSKYDHFEAHCCMTHDTVVKNEPEVADEGQSSDFQCGGRKTVTSYISTQA